ncbi:MAG: hypothetical protein ABJP66_19460 [Hyphomicrobiales bacterium]
MQVHEDAVRFPDGSEGIYGIVEKPDFALFVPRMTKLGYLFESYGYSNQEFEFFLAEGLMPGLVNREIAEQGIATAAFCS